jgi:lambda repressor-like predicted transcriptional regulator
MTPTPREWLIAQIRRRGWTATEVARAADLAPSTVLRAVGSASYAVSQETLTRIAAAMGLKVPEEVLKQAAPRPGRQPGTVNGETYTLQLDEGSLKLTMPRSLSRASKDQVKRWIDAILA